MATARNADKRHGHTEMNISSLVQPSVQTPQPRDVAFEPNLAKDTDQVIVPVPGLSLVHLSLTATVVTIP